jgi:dienelactone hydrolase
VTNGFASPGPHFPKFAVPSPDRLSRNSASHRHRKNHSSALGLYSPKRIRRVLLAAIVLAVALSIPSLPASGESSGAFVEMETPLANPHPLQGYLRQPAGKGPSPAVVLLHSCNGSWRRLDERWGKRIASWGYVTLAVDSFGPRGLQDTCASGATMDMAHDAYRALEFLVSQPFVDPARVAAIGFSQGGWLALASVEHGIIEKLSKNKFRSAAAFYPPCMRLKGNMTVPTLVLVGELDDWTPALECRKLAEGRDDYGVSRSKENGIPLKLIVYPGAHHAFDNPAFYEGLQYLGHHLEYNQEATDQSADALRGFLDATLRPAENKEPSR